MINGLLTNKSPNLKANVAETVLKFDSKPAYLTVLPNRTTPEQNDSLSNMTPDRRLDQLEPLVADVLQKVDRLVEGQSQLIDIATRADHNNGLAARSVANLTIDVQRGFLDVRQDIADIKNGQELILKILREKLP